VPSDLEAGGSEKDADSVKAKEDVFKEVHTVAY